MHKKYEIDSLPKYLHVSFSNNIKLNNIKQYKTNKPIGLYYANKIGFSDLTCVITFDVNGDAFGI